MDTIVLGNAIEIMSKIADRVDAHIRARSDLIKSLSPRELVTELESRGGTTLLRALFVPPGYALALVGPCTGSRMDGDTQRALDRANEAAARAMALVFDGEAHQGMGLGTRQERGEVRWPLYLDSARVAVAAALGVLSPRSSPPTAAPDADALTQGAASGGE